VTLIGTRLPAHESESNTAAHAIHWCESGE